MKRTLILLLLGLAVGTGSYRLQLHFRATPESAALDHHLAWMKAELNVSDEGARPDAGRGQPVQIVLRRGLIEVAAAAVLGADANVGETVPVTIRNTGRVVRAKLTEPGKALFVEGP